MKPPPEPYMRADEGRSSAEWTRTPVRMTPRHPSPEIFDCRSISVAPVLPRHSSVPAGTTTSVLNTAVVPDGTKLSTPVPSSAFVLPLPTDVMSMGVVNGCAMLRTMITPPNPENFTRAPVPNMSSNVRDPMSIIAPENSTGWAQLTGPSKTTFPRR